MSFPVSKKNEQLYALISIPFMAACLPLGFPYATLLRIFTDPQALLELLTYYPDWVKQPLLSIQSTVTYILTCVLFYLIWLVIENNNWRNKLRYIARAAVRYRLAAALFAMGIIKLIPVQLPEPTLSDLHTNYGDFSPWKIYYLTNSAAKAHHQSYLGLIEILAASALLHRKTASLGAGLAIAFLTNVILVNIAYQLQHTIFASYLFILAVFIISYDIPRLFSLFFLRKVARANRFQPIWSNKEIVNIRYALKSGFIMICAFFFWQVYQTRQSNQFPFPAKAGLTEKNGFYVVDSFAINGRVIPPSLNDEERWQDVVLEAWNTVSIRQHRHQSLETSAPSGVPLFDSKRYYEYAGNGGRNYYTYTADTLQRQLTLQTSDGSSVYHLQYESPQHDILLLRGTNEKQDTIAAKLIKQHRKYLIHEGRRKPIKI